MFLDLYLLQVSSITLCLSSRGRRKQRCMHAFQIRELKLYWKKKDYHGSQCYVYKTNAKKLFHCQQHDSKNLACI